MRVWFKCGYCVDCSLLSCLFANSSFSLEQAGYDPTYSVATYNMRGLTEDEAKTLFTKLSNYIGSNLVHLVDTTDDVSSSQARVVTRTDG